MSRRKPDPSSVMETLMVEYSSRKEGQRANLKELIHTGVTEHIDFLVNYGPPSDPDLQRQVAWYVTEDVYNQVLDARSTEDERRLSDAIDKYIAHCISICHDQVWKESAARAFQRHKVRKASDIWAYDAEQERFQGTLLCSFREFATPGAWQHLIYKVSETYGTKSPCVQELKKVANATGLPPF